MQNQRQADLWKILQSMRGQDSRRISSGSCTSLSSPDISCTESIVLIEENSRGFEKFAEVVENLKLDQINETLNLDWEFLEEDSGPDDKKLEGSPAS